MNEILGPDGKTPARDIKYDHCPKCGAGSENRVPSSGFGTPHLICKCGYEFEEKLRCPTVML